MRVITCTQTPRRKGQFVSAGEPYDPKMAAEIRRQFGRFRSAYYALKVTLALYVGVFRRTVTPLEDA